MPQTAVVVHPKVVAEDQKAMEEQKAVAVHPKAVAVQQVVQRQKPRVEWMLSRLKLV